MPIASTSAPANTSVGFRHRLRRPAVSPWLLFLLAQLGSVEKQEERREGNAEKKRNGRASGTEKWGERDGLPRAPTRSRGPP